MNLIKLIKNIFVFSFVLLMLLSCGGGGVVGGSSSDPADDPIEEDDGTVDPQNDSGPSVSQISHDNAVATLANKIGHAVDIYNAYVVVFETTLKNNLIAGDDGIVIFRKMANKLSVNCSSGIGDVDLEESSATARFTNCVIGDKTVNGSFTVSSLRNIADPESAFIEFLLADVSLEDLSIVIDGKRILFKGLLDTQFTASRNNQVRGVEILSEEFQLTNNGGEVLSLTDFNLDAGVFTDDNFEVVEIDYHISDSSSEITQTVATEKFFARYTENPYTGSTTVTDNLSSSVVANADNGDLATIQYTIEVNGATTSEVLTWEDSGLLDYFDTLRKLEGIIRVDTGEDRPEPALNITGTTVTEGDSGTKDAVFTVTLTESSSKTVTVDYTTQDGSAKSGSDYDTTIGTLSFDPGSTSLDIAVPIIGDRVNESQESFKIVLSSPSNATLGASEASGTIEDNDEAEIPNISIKGVTVTEGDSGTKDAVFRVSLSESSSKTITVKYTTKDGSAKSGSDYNTKEGTLTFNAGRKNETIRVQIIGDTKSENRETFTVELSSPNNATLDTSKATGTINDNDSGGGGGNDNGGGGGGGGGGGNDETDNPPASDLTIQRGKSKSFKVSGTCNKSFSLAEVRYPGFGGIFSISTSATRTGSSYTVTIRVIVSNNAAIKVYNFAGEILIRNGSNGPTVCSKNYSKKISVVK